MPPRASHERCHLRCAKARLFLEAPYSTVLEQAGLVCFHHFFRMPGQELASVHTAREAQRVCIGDRCAYLKREWRITWRDRVQSWWYGYGPVSRSVREHLVLKDLVRHGFCVPPPMASGENGTCAFLLLAELQGFDPLGQVLRNLLDVGQRTWIIQLVADQVARLHEAGYMHPDLYAKHVLVDVATGRVAFLDFQRTYRRRSVSFGQRCRDLAALDACLTSRLASSRERLVFLRTYLAVSRLPLSWRRPMISAVVRRTHHLLKRRKIAVMRAILDPPGDIHCQIALRDGTQAARADPDRIGAMLDAQRLAPLAAAGPSFPQERHAA